MLKFFEIEGRFPRHAGEVPPAAVDYLAHQLGLEAGAASRFEVVGRTAERHRTQIRDLLGFRVFSRGDEDKMIGWLADEVCPSELNQDRQREAVLARCRADKLEPPGRMDRIIGAANRAADQRFCDVTVARLPGDVVHALLSIIAEPEAETGPDPVDDEPSFFTELKADPGKLGLETLLAEITKLGGSGRSGYRPGCLDRPGFDGGCVSAAVFGCWPLIDSCPLFLDSPTVAPERGGVNLERPEAEPRTNEVDADK